MKIPYNTITAKDAEIFSVDSIHQQYWKDFCDVCYPRFGFESKEDGERTYEQKYETFRQCHVFAMQHFEWNEAMMFKVHEQDLQRFQEAYEFFINLSNDDNAAIPMLTVLLRIQQSIWNRLREDRQMMEYIYPRNCNISCEKYKVDFVANSPEDEHVVKDMGDLEKSILDKLYFERDWDYGWQQDISKAMIHQVDYYNDERIEWDETAGSLTQRLAGTIIDSYNYSLSTFESEYDHLVTARHGSVIHAIVYRLFMSYQTSLDEIKSIIEDYPAEICLAKLTDVRSELIEEFKKNKLGKHWYECVKSKNGLEKVGRFLINHRNTISEEEEERFFYLLDEICIITDILKGNAAKYWLNVEYNICVSPQKDENTVKYTLTSNRQSIYNQLLALVDKGDWKCDEIADSVKQMLRTILGQNETPLLGNEAEQSETLWRLLESGRGDRVKIVWQNMVGYLDDKKLLRLKGSPALNKDFFGDDKGYTNIDKGRPSKGLMTADFESVIPLLDAYVPKLDKKA